MLKTKMFTFILNKINHKEQGRRVEKVRKGRSGMAEMVSGHLSARLNIRVWRSV